MVKIRTQFLRGTAGVCPLLLAFGGLLAGCGGPDLPGVEEYKQITTQARTAVQASLHSLEQVGAAPSPCPAHTAAAFERDLQRMEVDSIKLRERSQAILARGDAYFDDWSESIARLKNPKIRENAARSHAELQQSFNRIKSACQQARASFKPFMAGLRELQVKLEANPAVVGEKPTGDLVRNTRENGQQVLQQFDVINSELSAFKKMLTTP
jgi:phage shock protein A